MDQKSCGVQTYIVKIQKEFGRHLHLINLQNQMTQVQACVTTSSHIYTGQWHFILG